MSMPEGIKLLLCDWSNKSLNNFSKFTYVTALHICTKSIGMALVTKHIIENLSKNNKVRVHIWLTYFNVEYVLIVVHH